jgi:hypothetical protein
MCERTCPHCKSTEHIESYGICGLSLICEGCGAALAGRFDEAAAPLDEPDPTAYARARSFVIPGAEASDPKDDEIFVIRAN